MTVAALFVDPSGIYARPPQDMTWDSGTAPQVITWDSEKDARTYAGPHPVVAHPPCQRWGRFWHGSTRRPHQYRLGEDGGCFAAALTAVRNYGGVLEHCADSHAWAWFGLAAPSREGGWIKADDFGGFTCYVEQGFYGHFSRKPTWLYACKTELPELRWGRGAQRLHPVALAKYGYEKARRIGIMSMVGGKDKTKIRDATPSEFAALLINLAQTVKNT
jgi:hypothetical protein